MNKNVRIILFIEIMVAIIAIPLAMVALSIPSNHPFGTYVFSIGIALCIVMLLLVGAIVWSALEHILTIKGVL